MGSQQRRPGSQHACTLPDRATARAALPYFSFTCSCMLVVDSIARLLTYAKANIFSTGHICQGVYYGSVSPFPEGYDLALLFAALADRTRLRLLNLMDGREVCVCYFVEILGRASPRFRGISPTCAARALWRRGARASGCTTKSRPPNSGAAKILRETLKVLNNDKAMQADLVRLNRACCAPQKLSALDGAPLPVPVEASSCPC